MFFALLSDGNFVSGGTTNWQDLIKRLKEEKLSIQQLGLTDMGDMQSALIGADSYYYFTDGEMVISNRSVSGGKETVTAPKVIGEEICGFYSPDTITVSIDRKVRNIDKMIEVLEGRLKELRSMTITSDEVQDQINGEIKQKVGARDQLKFSKKRMLEERAQVIEAGGVIMSKRLDISTEKLSLNIGPEAYKETKSRILDQDRQYWFGSKVPFK